LGTRNAEAVRMSDDAKRFTGGCPCGAVRYEATGEPEYMGLCFCPDCRKASGRAAPPDWVPMPRGLTVFDAMPG
jgi:hypothetical protein